MLITSQAFNWATNRPEVKHFRVYGSVQEGFYISKKKSFSTLNDLIEDYMHDNGTELSMLLKTPCVRFEPELPDISRECVDNWEVPREVLQWKKKIGQGSYGEVWLCESRRLGRPRAETRDASLFTDICLYLCNLYS